VPVIKLPAAGLPLVSATLPLPVRAGAQGAAEVFAAARRGERAAFARLIRDHQGLVYSVALRICGSRTDAEELAQDAFLKLHGQLGSLASADHLRHWLIRTVSHRAIDRLRQRSREPTGDDATLHLIEEPGQDSDPLLTRKLAALLARLPGPARAVVVLRFQEDLDPTDIARALDMSINTVKSHLRRSLEWLRGEATELDHEH
jgi:RNA polymerase sigma-70 factor (ECF subfamily)